MASVWEMGIKISLGRLDLGTDLEGFIRRHVVGNGMDLLPITTKHVAKVVALPFHHRDPFDRLLIAQAQGEDLPVVGRDPEFGKYGISIVW